MKTQQTIIYLSMKPRKDNTFYHTLMNDFSSIAIIFVPNESEFKTAVKQNKPHLILVDSGIAAVFKSTILSVITEFHSIPLLLVPETPPAESPNRAVNDPGLAVFSASLKALLQNLREKDTAAVVRKLHEAEDRFFQAFYHSPLPMAIVRAHDNMIVETNDLIAQSLDYPYEGLIGTNLTELDASWNGTDPTDFYQLLNKDRIVRNFPMKMKKFNGELFDAIVFAEAMNVGSVLCYLFIFFDITEFRAGS